MDLDEAFGLVGEFGPQQKKLAAFLVLLQVGLGTAGGVAPRSPAVFLGPIPSLPIRRAHNGGEELRSCCCQGNGNARPPTVACVAGNAPASFVPRRLEAKGVGFVSSRSRGAISSSSDLGLVKKKTGFTAFLDGRFFLT